LLDNVTSYRRSLYSAPMTLKVINVIHFHWKKSHKIMLKQFIFCRKQKNKTKTKTDMTTFSTEEHMKRHI